MKTKKTFLLFLTFSILLLIIFTTSSKYSEYVYSTYTILQSFIIFFIFFESKKELKNANETDIILTRHRSLNGLIKLFVKEKTSFIFSLLLFSSTFVYLNSVGFENRTILLSLTLNFFLLFSYYLYFYLSKEKKYFTFNNTIAVINLIVLVILTFQSYSEIILSISNNSLLNNCINSNISNYSVIISLLTISLFLYLSKRLITKQTYNKQ